MENRTKGNYIVGRGNFSKGRSGISILKDNMICKKSDKRTMMDYWTLNVGELWAGFMTQRRMNESGVYVEIEDGGVVVCTI